MFHGRQILSHALFSLEACDVHWILDMSNQARRCQGMQFIITTFGRPPSAAGTFAGWYTNHGPIGRCIMCCTSCVTFLILLEESGWDEVSSSQLYRAEHFKCMSGWSWRQVEQDGPIIGNYERKSFDKLSQLGPVRMVRILTWKVSWSFHAKHRNGALFSSHYTRGQVCQKKAEIKCEAPDQAQNRAVNVGKWPSKLNHTYILYFNSIQRCEKVDRNAGKWWF